VPPLRPSPSPPALRQGLFWGLLGFPVWDKVRNESVSAPLDRGKRLSSALLPQTGLGTPECRGADPGTPVVGAVPQFPHRRGGRGGCEEQGAADSRALLVTGIPPQSAELGGGQRGGCGDPFGGAGPGEPLMAWRGGGCFSDMLQLINTPDDDFSGLFDLPFGAPDSAVPPGLPPAPATLGTYLGPSKPPPAAPTGSVYPGPPGMAAFAPQPPAPLLPAPAPGVKEEAAVPSSQPQPGAMLAPGFVPGSPGQFSSQPLVGYQNQHSFSGEDLGVRGGSGLSGWGLVAGGLLLKGDGDVSLRGGGPLVPGGPVTLCSAPCPAVQPGGAGQALPSPLPAPQPGQPVALPSPVAPQQLLAPAAPTAQPVSPQIQPVPVSPKPGVGGSQWSPQPR